MATAAEHQTARSAPGQDAADAARTAAQESAFDAAVAADERIEPRDWMPDAYRASLVRQMR